MSVTRINEFQAKEGLGDTLREVLSSFLPVIKASEGCHSCQLLQGIDDPSRLVVIEVWESPEAHQAAVKNISGDSMQQALSLLDAPPRGANFRLEEQ